MTVPLVKLPVIVTKKEPGVEEFRVQVWPADVAPAVRVTLVGQDRRLRPVAFTDVVMTTDPVSPLAVAGRLDTVKVVEFPVPPAVRVTSAGPVFVMRKS